MTRQVFFVKPVVCLFTSNLKQEHVTVFMLACCNVFDIKFVCDNIL